jgi:CRP-like cAMP-binding protein
MTFTCRNSLLASLEPSVVLRAGAKIQRTTVRRGSKVQEIGDLVQWVWFPENALICVTSETLSGESLSGGMIGWNGVYGAFEACGSRTSFARATVQIAGEVYRIRADHYRELFDRSSALRTSIHKHVEAMLVESRQLVACAALHSVESRLCRALLDASERSHGGNLLSITQESLAQMLGVQRTTVAVTASTLQKSGFIRSGRGVIELLNTGGIEAASCSCRQTIAYAVSSIYASREEACEA